MWLTACEAEIAPLDVVSTSSGQGCLGTCGFRTPSWQLAFVGNANNLPTSGPRPVSFHEVGAASARKRLLVVGDKGKAFLLEVSCGTSSEYGGPD